MLDEEAIRANTHTLSLGGERGQMNDNGMTMERIDPFVGLLCSVHDTRSVTAVVFLSSEHCKVYRHWPPNRCLPRLLKLENKLVARGQDYSERLHDMKIA